VLDEARAEVLVRALDARVATRDLLAGRGAARGGRGRRGAAAGARAAGGGGAAPAAAAVSAPAPVAAPVSVSASVAAPVAAGGRRIYLAIAVDAAIRGGRPGETTARRHEYDCREPVFPLIRSQHDQPASSVSGV